MSENIFTSAVAASSIPAASVDFVVEGRKKRAPKNNPAKPPAKKGKKNVEITEISRPIVSGARFTNQVVSLSDAGVLKIDGRQVIQYDKPTMELIKKLGIDRSKLPVQNSSGSYLYYGKDSLHSVLGASLKQKHFDYLVKRDFTGSIDDLTNVSHLDDNALNNNISNLLNLPAPWNQNLKKAKGAKPARKKFCQQVVISESDAYNTVCVSDPDEALLQYDILKTKHSLDHVVLCPKLAQELIFEYGLVRPRKFVNLGYYKSIETLLSHQNDWTKDPTKQGRKGKKYVKKDRFRRLDLNDPDLTQAIHDSLKKPGNLPFDALLHVIFEYVGKKVRHQRIVNRDFYESTVKDYIGQVHESAEGYMIFNKLGGLHNLALGRKRGDHARDKLQGCHGVGGKLENRVTKKPDGKLDQRTLTLGTAATNGSHIVRKKAGSHSIYPGVEPSGNQFSSFIRFDGTKYSFYRSPDEIEAANAYAHVQEHREETAARLAIVPKEASKDVKRSLRAANLVIVKTYIKSTLHDTVAIIRDNQ